MPVKIRELKARLSRAGFTKSPGKGSHTNWVHPKFPGRVTVAGADGSDAKHYQIVQVTKAIKKVQGDD